MNENKVLIFFFDNPEFFLINNDFLNKFLKLKREEKRKKG